MKKGILAFVLVALSFSICAQTPIGSINEPLPVYNSDFAIKYEPKVAVDTRTHAVSGFLPPSPVIGQKIEFFDAKGTWDIHNFTVSGNGKTIESDPTLVCDVAHKHVCLIFVGGTIGWTVTL